MAQNDLVFGTRSNPKASKPAATSAAAVAEVDAQLARLRSWEDEGNDAPVAVLYRELLAEVDAAVLRGEELWPMTWSSGTGIR